MRYLLKKRREKKNLSRLNIISFLFLNAQLICRLHISTVYVYGWLLQSRTHAINILISSGFVSKVREYT